MSTPLLSVRGLSIAFGRSEAVRGISFDIPPGETLGLVGESGSGKSATSLALLRLLPPTASISGQILLSSATEPGAPFQPGAPFSAQPHRAISGLITNAGVSPQPGTSGNQERQQPNPHENPRTSLETSIDLLSLPEEAIRQHRGRSLAMIFQEPMTALNPVMPIGHQVAEAVLAHAPRTPRRVLRTRVLAALHEVALPDPERRLRDYPHQFSGGQRQRIVIAMALINRPRLLIADEPTTALDVTVQAQILALLKRLRAEHGLSMLFISHDLAVVGEVADRIAVMRHGQILETGPSHQLLTRPQHPYTRGLLAAAPTMQTPRDRPLAALAGVD